MIRSKSKLLQALTELISDKQLESITVADLIRQAKVSRSTFYRDFIDKRDFLEWVMDEMLVKGIEQQSWYTKSSDSQSYFHNFFQFMEKNKIYFRVFSQSTVWPQFREKFMKNAQENYAALLQRTQPSVPVDLLAAYITGAHAAVIDYWLNSENEYSAADLADLFIKLTQNGALIASGVQEKLDFPS